MTSFFERSPPWDQVVYWALDLETSGLEVKRDQILSVGMVPIRGGAIHWGERFYSLVRPPDPGALSEDGIRAHHILPAELQGAPPLAAVLPAIESRLSEGALLLHFAAIDLVFLRKAFREAQRRWPHPPVVDTVELLARLDKQRAYLDPHAASLPTGLAEARAALDLPPHDAHHALADALATAELMLALRARLDAKSLKDLR
jgi:DNA polymerase-3 subunit epsilon